MDATTADKMTRAQREKFYIKQQSYYRSLAENEAKLALHYWFPNAPLVRSISTDPASWRDLWRGECFAQQAVNYAAHLNTGLIYMGATAYSVATGNLVLRASNAVMAAPRTVYRGMRLGA